MLDAVPGRLGGSPEVIRQLFSLLGKMLTSLRDVLARQVSCCYASGGACMRNKSVGVTRLVGLCSTLPSPVAPSKTARPSISFRTVVGGMVAAVFSSLKSIWKGRHGTVDGSGPSATLYICMQQRVYKRAWCVYGHLPGAPIDLISLIGVYNYGPLIGFALADKFPPQPHNKD